MPYQYIRSKIKENIRCKILRCATFSFNKGNCQLKFKEQLVPLNTQRIWLVKKTPLLTYVNVVKRDWRVNRDIF